MTTYQLDAVHLSILEHCRNGPASLRALEGRAAPHTPLYRHAGELRQSGLLKSPKKGLWQTTEAGVRTLEESKAGILENPMDKRYPPLRLLPMPLQAFARLMMLADIARRHRLRENHHVFGLLFGDTMTLKTTVGQFLAYAFGEDPTRAIVLTPTESGRSVGVRKTYAGRTASIRAALSWRFVCFDEFHKASPATKRTIIPYLMGQLRVPLENDVLEVKPVALVITNPFPGKTLREWTGFGSAELRRGMPCRVTATDIPEDARLRGEEIVEAARKAGPITLPKPTGVRFRPEDAAALLRSSLTMDARVIVDFETVSMLAEAMSGITDDCLPFVVRDILTCYETVGLVDPAWRARLSGAAIPATISMPQIQKPLTLREQTLAILEEVGHVIDGGLDAHVRVQKLDAILREHKLDPEVAARRVQTMAAWNKAGFPWSVLVAAYEKWKATGKAEQFTHVLAAIVERFGTFQNWEKTMAEQSRFLKKYGGSWDDVVNAIQLRAMCGDLGITMDTCRTFLQKAMEESSRRGLDPGKAVFDLFDLMKQHNDVLASIVEHQREEDAEKQQLNELRQQRAQEQQKQREEIARWAEEQSSSESDRKRQEDVLESQAREIEFRKKEVESLKTERQKHEEQLASLQGPLSIGLVLQEALQTGEVKAVVASAQRIVELSKNPYAFGRREGGHILYDYDENLRSFINHLTHPCIPLREHERLMEEKDKAIAALKTSSDAQKAVDAQEVHS